VGQDAPEKFIHLYLRWVSISQNVSHILQPNISGFISVRVGQLDPEYTIEYRRAGLGYIDQFSEYEEDQ